MLSMSDTKSLILGGRHYYLSDFANGETEAWSWCVTCPRVLQLADDDGEA